MTWMLTILAVNLCVHGVIEAHTSHVTSSGAAIDDASPSHTSTAGSDVDRCATIDDVITARRSLCPAQSRCWPLDDQEVLTKLTVNCSGAQFNRSTLRRLSQDLTKLLSRCVSELTDLTITNTPITTVPEVVCKLSKIRSLNFNSNQLTSLPSDCFTRTLNLTSFSATGNRLKSLQVRYDVTMI